MRGRAAPPLPRIYRVTAAPPVLTKCDVNVWLDIGHVFYAFFYGWRSRTKERKSQYPILTLRLFNKGFIIWPKEIMTFENKVSNRNQASIRASTSLLS